MPKEIIMAIVIGVIFVISILFLGLLAKKIKTVASENENTFYNQIVGTLCKIPLMLWYPIQAIIEILYGVSYRFNESVHETFKSEEYVNAKIQKLVRNSVSSVLHSHSNLLNTYSNRRVARALTALLQIVSFITTYAGFTFFIGTVNPIAPLFMAIVVQGCCYYLLNYASSRKRTGVWKRHILLCVLIITSTVTSYIGIFDGVVQPVNIMKDQYESYAEAVETIIDQETKTFYNLNIELNEIEKATLFIEHTYIDANNKIQSLNNQANRINTQTAIQKTYTDENGNILHDIVREEYPEASIKKAELMAQSDTLKNHTDKLENYVNANLKASDIFEACKNIMQSSIETANEKDKNIWNTFVNALYDCSLLYSELYPDAEGSDNEAKTYYKSMKIDEEINAIKGKNLLEDLKLDAFEKEILGEGDEVTDDLKIKENIISKNENYEVLNDTLNKMIDSVFGAINFLNEIVVSENSTQAQTIRNAINETINDNYISLYNRISDNNKSKLNSARDNAVIENPQIMPFTMLLTNKAVRGEAIFSFVIAVLVDGLSLLIAFALINKQKSILYFEKVVDLRATREEMLEDCLMYICLNNFQNDPSYKINTISRTEIQDCVAKKINDVMRDFMSKINQIYLSDNLNSFGYISEDEISSFNDDEMRLFYTLNNAALIHPCHSSEIIKIINADFNEYVSTEPKANDMLINKYKNIFTEDKIFYIVSKNLHFWFCENFSELLQNSMLFETKVVDLSFDSITGQYETAN